MNIIKNFRIVSHQIFDTIKDIKENPDTYQGFSKWSRDEKQYSFDTGKIYVKYHKTRNEVEICIYDGLSDNPFIEIVGIPIEYIESEESLFKAIREEIECVIGTYERYLEELN